jgi:hypothetical protein
MAEPTTERGERCSDDPIMTTATPQCRSLGEKWAFAVDYGSGERLQGARY